MLRRVEYWIVGQRRIFGFDDIGADAGTNGGSFSGISFVGEFDVLGILWRSLGDHRNHLETVARSG